MFNVLCPDWRDRFEDTEDIYITTNGTASTNLYLENCIYFYKFIFEMLTNGIFTMSIENDIENMLERLIEIVNIATEPPFFGGVGLCEDLASFG